MRVLPRTAIIATLLAGASFTAVAQNTPTAASPSPDANFVMKASAAGATEIAAAQLAQTQSQSDAVKAYAQTLITDHTQAAQQLTAIAQKDGYASSLSTTTPMLPAKLKNAQGAAFDKAFDHMMIHDHQQAISLFKTESNAGTNTDLKNFAAQTLPTLQHHLSVALSLKGK